jgi:hypothetical protein
MQLVIDPGGNVRCVYSEEIDLGTIGQLNIRRGSHVEPNECGQWIVDLSPVDGPKLGPFTCRSVALTAEAQWLEQHWLPCSVHKQCDCEQPGYFCSGVPGILAHLEDNKLAADTAVERCDLCERYPSDAAARRELKRCLAVGKGRDSDHSQ